MILAWTWAFTVMFFNDLPGGGGVQVVLLVTQSLAMSSQLPAAQGNSNISPPLQSINVSHLSQDWWYSLFIPEVHSVMHPDPVDDRCAKFKRQIHCYTFYIERKLHIDVMIMPWQVENINEGMICFFE